jgi:hypothetical protein
MRYECHDVNSLSHVRESRQAVRMGRGIVTVLFIASLREPQTIVLSFPPVRVHAFHAFEPTIRSLVDVLSFCEVREHCIIFFRYQTRSIANCET